MKLIKVLFVVIVSLVITNVTMTNTAVDEGIAMADLTREIQELQNANTIARAQVANLGSLGSLASKIEAEGFIQSSEVLALESPVSVASR